MNVRETPRTKPRYGIDPYLDWLAREGIPVTEDYGVYLFGVETAPWPRYGVKGAAVHLTGRGDFANMFVFDIAPGKSTAPQRHLYEEVVYVLEGHGSTQLEFADGSRRSFEWGAKSLFAIPLNAKYRHFNGSGTERALLVSTTNLPMVMNVFHNEQFVFGCDFEFSDRAGKQEYFAGEGDLITVRPGNHMWETNFVPDLTAIELKSWGDRGGGGTNIMFVLADGTMHAHISEMPVGAYKKAHRHGPSFHVMCVIGQGFSLLWYEHEKDFRRIDWQHGMVLVPADRQFHQHFNTGPQPARYLATAVGGLRYPTMWAQRVSLLGASEGDTPAVSKSVKEGGDQIEYEDQDPRIHRIWLEEMRRNGATPKMEKYVATPEDMKAAS
jgi:quercetin dioxygenase-like cupin family protein/oxalate decarboxylase/phosphoglucose isomerase-like protein (cupin superfamily)